MAQTKPNRRVKCDFRVHYKKADWHIYGVWVSHDGELCWFDATTERGPVTIKRMFSPNQIKIPKHIVEQINERNRIDQDGNRLTAES